jgi:hypothetical protein
MLGLPWSIGNVASAHVVFFLMLFRKHCRTGGLLLLTLKNGAAAIVVTSATHRAFEKGKRSDAVVETASSAVSGNASFSPSAAAADSCGAAVATRSKSVTPSIGKTEPFSPDLAIAVKESGDGQTIVPHNAPRGEAAHSYDCS